MKAKKAIAVLCALCVPCVLPTAAARLNRDATAATETASVPIVAETLLDDGSTNTWTQADLVAALGLLNRRYRRDIKTPSGRRAWHGAETKQTLTTNAAGRLVMRRTYADGFTYDDVARAQTAREAASNMAARVRASLPTNGVSPRVASLRARSAAASVTGETNVTVVVDGVTVRRAPRYERAYDAYGNETNRALVGWMEYERNADGSLTVRTLDAEGNVLSTHKPRVPVPAAAQKEAAK